MAGLTATKQFYYTCNSNNWSVQYYCLESTLCRFYIKFLIIDSFKCVLGYSKNILMV